MQDRHPTTLPLTQLQPNPFQPREKIKKEDITDLIDSMKSFGVLEPLVVAQTPAGYQIIAGERRWRAAKELGLESVPVVIKKTTPKGMLEMALVENVQRTNLHPLERAQAFMRLKREFGLSLDQIAEKIGKSASYVSNSIKLLSLPDAIADGLSVGLISEGHARALMAIDDEKMMVDCYRAIVRESGSVRRAEEMARNYKEFAKRENRRLEKNERHRIINIRDERLLALQKRMRSELNAPSVIRLQKSQTLTRLVITLKGPPEATVNDLEKIIKLLEGVVA